LVEGKYYHFKVLKTVNLPEEGDHYMLRHKSGRRLLLPAEPYNNYCIGVNSTIECKVDKINCTGKVFLEPRHPVYIEDKIYDFTVHQNSVKDINLNETITVHDVFNNEVQVNWPSNKSKLPEIGTNIKLRVDRLTNGVPILNI
jgi:hypothetical protein